MLLFLSAIADEDNREAIVYLYDRYHGDMLKTAARVLGDAKSRVLDSEDAVQNAFLKIIKYWNDERWAEMKRDERRMRAYVMAVVTNEALTILQKDAIAVDLDEVADSVISDDDFAERLCIKDQYRRVVEEITKLDDRYSIPLQMRYVEELSVNQIAELLGISPKTVYTNLRRGKILLLKQLEKEERR